MGKLEELKELYIGNTDIEEIPPCIGSLKKLEVLDAKGCKSLVGLPKSISHLINLSTLDLRGCSELCRLPESIKSLVKLQRLSLEGVGISEVDCFHIPNSIGKLECYGISGLPSTVAKLGNLEQLDATRCESLGREIPIDQLSSFKILRLSSTGISSFPTFNKLSHLEELNLYNCKMLESLPQTISKLPSLQQLELRSCDNLQSLLDLPVSLTVLGVTCQHCTLPQLSHLVHLKEFAIVDCRLLESLPKLPSGLLELHVHMSTIVMS
ncbi:hypothetical protein EUGRSUZ_D02405 [Eucalyptus grandis]|uniref:NB-ARC domain-containing protein n=1 Tax=Eucalyptus grandis TaxID=71139 RepID=A0A059CJV3_EUCGR|nr:hypothetical protein EUGRSUZ_D02405 [Eucalyptus grandis]